MRNLGFSAADQREAGRAYEEFENTLRKAAPASDRAGDAIPHDHRWRPYLDMLSGALNGAELDRVSARDLLAYDDHASEENWRLPQGYGTLIAGMAGTLPVRYGTKVTAIDHGSTPARIGTDKGSIEARSVIVTVPTDILARGDILFSPAIEEHLHAAACLPLGHVDKLFLAMEDAQAVPPETHLLGNPHDALTGSYYLRPFGRPVIECFFGGIAARAMEQAGDAGRFAFATEELGCLLGADFARRLRPTAGSWWCKEASIGGAYSHTLPGHAEKRALLASSPSDRLHFAGEACSASD